MKNLLLVLAIMAMSVGSAHGQVGDLFFSFESGGATVDNPRGAFNPGDTGSVFVYYIGTSDLDSGATFELSTDAGGVINFTGGEVFNNPAGADGLPRWSTVDATLSDDLQVVEGAFINLPPLTPNVGVDVDNPTLDADFDPATNSFGIARADFEVVGEGLTNISISGQFVSSGAALDLTLGSITIDSAAIPEPTSAGLLAVVAAGLIGRRRR